MRWLAAFRRRGADLGTLIEGFLLARQAEGRTPQTISWYRCRLDRLPRWLGEVDVRDLTAERIRHFLVAIKQGTAGTGRPVSDRYVEQHRKAAGTFFAWAVEEGYLETSPMERVRPVRWDEKEIAVLTEDDITRILATQLRHGRFAFEGARNQVMVSLLYDTGVRVGELVKIDVDDVDLVDGSTRICGKSRRDRRVPLSRLMRARLWDYLNHWRPPAVTPRLFVSRHGDPLLENAVNQWMRRAKAKAGIIGKRVSPHIFRHSFGTAYIRNGGDQFSAMKILGHTTTKMTNRYVHLAHSDVQARHAQASPLEHMGH